MSQVWVGCPAAHAALPLQGQVRVIRCRQTGLQDTGPVHGLGAGQKVLGAAVTRLLQIRAAACGQFFKVTCSSDAVEGASSHFGALFPREQRCIRSNKIKKMSYIQISTFRITLPRMLILYNLFFNH